jgi:hypothetical protein
MNPHDCIGKTVKRISWYYTDRNDEVPHHAIVIGTGEKVYVDKRQLLISVEGRFYQGMVFDSGGWFFDNYTSLSQIFGKYLYGDPKSIFIDIEAWNRITYYDVDWLNANENLKTIYINTYQN